MGVSNYHAVALQREASLQKAWWPMTEAGKPLDVLAVECRKFVDDYCGGSEAVYLDLYGRFAALRAHAEAAPAPDVQRCMHGKSQDEHCEQCVIDSEADDSQPASGHGEPAPGLSEAEIRIDEIDRITELWTPLAEKAVTHKEMIKAVISVLRERTELARAALTAPVPKP